MVPTVPQILRVSAERVNSVRSSITALLNALERQYTDDMACHVAGHLNHGEKAALIIGVVAVGLLSHTFPTPPCRHTYTYTLPWKYVSSNRNAQQI